MNLLHELVNYHHFSFLSFSGLITKPWKDMIHTISAFRKKTAENETFILRENPNEDLLEEFSQSIDNWLDDFGPAAGKSLEELRSLRKETVSAIQEKQTALAATIYEMSRTTGKRTLDSKTKIAGLDVQFDRLMSELEEKEEDLADYNKAISKFFSRRDSDNRAQRQSISA